MKNYKIFNFNFLLLTGLRYHYFTVPWNVFDFLLVLASIFGILMEDIMIDLPISPTLLRVVRVFRIGRILRLIKVSKFHLHNNYFKIHDENNPFSLSGCKRNPETFICLNRLTAGFIQYWSSSGSRVVCLRYTWNVTLRAC